MQNNIVCPAHANAMPWLWEHNKPVLDELRTVVEPLAETLDIYITADMSQRDIRANEAYVGYVQHAIPFGVPYTLLPPRFFSRLYEGEEAPQLPRDEAAARQLVASYGLRREEPPMPDMPKGLYTSMHEARLGHVLDDLIWMARQGVSIDPARWEQYRQVAREQAENGRYDMDIISVGRGNSVKSLYSYPALARLAHFNATGVFDHFASMPTSALDANGHSTGLLPVGHLFMPVGAYGPSFSEKMLRTTAYMVDSAPPALAEQASSLAAAHPDVVAKHMTRSRDGWPMDASLITTIQEGVRSSMETVALLTAEKVPGYDNPDHLLQVLMEQGIIEEFTRAIPMGMLGPLTFAGKYFPNLLLAKENGKLALNPDVMHEIKQAKRAMAQQDMAEWAIYWAASEEDRKGMMPPVATSLVCPAAMPYGALWRLNNIFFRAYQVAAS